MARWNVKPPVERVRNGFRINLRAEERDLVDRLLDELQALLVGPSDNPALRRVFPAAYHLAENAEHDAEYQRLMREELVGSRLAAIEVVLAVLAPDVPEKPHLDAEQLGLLMTSLNSLRLVLGTICDVGEDDDLAGVTPDHPLFAELQAYGYLSYLVDAAVDALAADL